MKRIRAVESDSVKSARKAKGKLHKPFKERQKLVRANLRENWAPKKKSRPHTPDNEVILYRYRKGGRNHAREIVASRV